METATAVSKVIYALPFFVTLGLAVLGLHALPFGACGGPCGVPAPK